jgi:hypothetical protein
VIGENTADDLTADDRRCAGEQSLLTGLRDVRAGLSHPRQERGFADSSPASRREAEPSGVTACNRSGPLLRLRMANLLSATSRSRWRRSRSRASCSLSAVCKPPSSSSWLRSKVSCAGRRWAKSSGTRPIGPVRRAVRSGRGCGRLRMLHIGHGAGQHRSDEPDHHTGRSQQAEQTSDQHQLDRGAVDSQRSAMCLHTLDTLGGDDRLRGSG